MKSPELRAATKADAEAIAEIYNIEVLQSTATFDTVPRSVDDQRQWLADRDGAYDALVAVLDGKVVGFGSLSPFRDRPAYRTTVENSIYVHRDFHRAGIATALMTQLIERARAHGFHSVIARIAADQAPSIALHGSLGFTMVGIEKEVGRKFNRWLDVAIMQLLL